MQAAGHSARLAQTARARRKPQSGQRDGGLVQVQDRAPDIINFIINPSKFSYMEEKKTNGQQAEQPAQGTEKEQSAWLQEVIKTFGNLTAEMDQAKDQTRAMITIAVHKGQAAIIKVGGTLPLAHAVKEILTGSAFVDNIADACRLMAAQAAQEGDGTIVIHVGNDQDDNDPEGTDKETQTDE